MQDYNKHMKVYLCASGFLVFDISLFCSETRPEIEKKNGL